MVLKVGLEFGAPLIERDGMPKGAHSGTGYSEWKQVGDPNGADGIPVSRI